MLDPQKRIISKEKPNVWFSVKFPKYKISLFEYLLQKFEGAILKINFLEPEISIVVFPTKKILNVGSRSWNRF